MAIINIFTKQNPSLGIGDVAVEFDVVFEDTLDASVEYTQFPIEIGANATDHGIVLPARYTLSGGVSNNPLSVSLVDLALGATSNIIDSGIFNTFGAFLASFLSGSNSTRAGSTLEFLLNLMYARQPFDVDAGDVTLQNMVITNITRTKNAANEGGLEFIAEMQELPLISTVITRNQPGQSVLRAGSPEATQATALINGGQVRLETVIASTVALVSSAL